jgi:DNA-directed RNA polymerase specialized sigma24 family protein
MEVEKMLKAYPETGKNVFAWNRDLNCFIATALTTRDSQKILDGLPRNTDVNDPTAETVLCIQQNLVEILQELVLSSEDVKRMTIDALQFKRKVDAKYMELEPEERRVIDLRYLKGLEWLQVSKKANYSERQCRYIGERFIKSLTLP